MSIIRDKFRNPLFEGEAGDNAKAIKEFAKSTPPRTLAKYAIYGWCAFLFTIFSLIVTVGVAIKIGF